jgi:predicted transposase/invertase (TIGR01784 family)
MVIDHDRLFKQLLSTFFLEFLDLFLPEMAREIDPDSIRFLPQEYFTDLITGEKHLVDVLIEVRQAGVPAAFLIHLEAQSTSEADFVQRIFFYFAKLYQAYRQRIYPIVVFSFDQPYREEPHSHVVEFPRLKVLEFNFEPIQLNRLNWRDYLNRSNPVAAALMSKMRIDPRDRPKVKAECLRILTTLRLDPARTQLISGFVDTYLRLNVQEIEQFQAEIGRMDLVQQEQIMQLTTSWKEEGILEGIQQGRQEGELQLVLRLLERRVGVLPAAAIAQIQPLSIAQIESLGEALLDFSGFEDLTDWLQLHR